MTVLTPVGMNPSGQFVIAQTGDTLNGLSLVAYSDSYTDLTNQPSIPAAQVNSDWNASSGVAQILNKPTIPSVPVSSVFSRTGAVVSANGDYTTSQVTEGSNLYYTDERAQDAAAAMLVAGTGLTGTYNDPANTYTFAAPRTTSALSLSLVGTGATGTQISATKDSTIRCTVSTSTTSTIGGPSTSVVVLKICATNNATEGSWTTVATFESDQTITLAIALQSIQIVKGQLCADVPAGWYAKLVNSGTGTHAESFISGQQTTYG